MCQLCSSKPVYEFTNQRKLCARCFVNYFVKKFLYTLRKFEMINQEDVVGYSAGNSLKKVVLKHLLFLAKDKYHFELVKLPSKKAKKFAIDSSLDSESQEIVDTLLHKISESLKKSLPVEMKIIKPIYLFLDEEILLYAKIKKLKFKQEKNKKDKIEIFLKRTEEKHPEVKRAIVNSLLKMYTLS